MAVKPDFGLAGAAQWLMRKLVAIWVRATVAPEDIAGRLAGRARPVCYVLEHDSLSDFLTLQDVCVAHALPRPARRLNFGSLSERRSVFYMEGRTGFLRQRVDRRVPPLLADLVARARADATLDLDIVPVAIYWGRAPQKEGSLLRLLFSENWAFAGRLRKLFTVLVNGRNVVLQFGDPLALREFLEEPLDEARAVRRISRLLRAHFRNQRAATIGPDLSHRRTIVSQVLRTRAVRVAVLQEMRERQQSRREALLTAKRFADEIAANYSHAFVSLLARVLSRVWNRLYDGLIVRNLDVLTRAADGREIVYVPCHRSHMDYLLLSYVIYQNGLAVPHIAAGVNLNLPILGRFLRKGGAFFTRRSFKGASLYPIVFMKYLGVMLAKGHSLEYFVEGGRSRTGRLLAPRTGMLSMTVRSYLRDPRRPVIFLPVYFGYERLVEGDTYIGELSGRPKERESVGRLLKALPKLRQKFGHVFVNFGEPIELDDVLKRHNSEWRQQTPQDDSRPPWIGAVVDELAVTIMRNINGAAAVNPVNLLATALLATPRQAFVAVDLARQIDVYRRLLAAARYGPRVTLCEEDGEAVIRYCESMGFVQRQKHPLGDVLRMTETNAILQTYFRNNVVHLFAMPSLIACCFVNNATMRTQDILRLAWRIYPYVGEELFLHWREDQVPDIVQEHLRVFLSLGLLTANEDGTAWSRPPPAAPEAVQLSLLAQATIQTVERYYLAIALLVKAGSGSMTAAALEERCHLMAQRMSMLYGFNSPEFFDKDLFGGFIDLLRRRAVIHTDPAGKLAFNEVLLNVAADAQLVLAEQIRHSILQVTHS
jgi:glycerol-3-phosphate O-acyltransferase